MSDLWERLNKLKGRSLAELRVRGAQKLSAYAERHGLSRQSRLPTDAALLGLLDKARFAAAPTAVVGSSRVDLQACKLEYSIVSPK